MTPHVTDADVEAAVHAYAEGIAKHDAEPVVNWRECLSVDEADSLRAGIRAVLLADRTRTEAAARGDERERCAAIADDLADQHLRAARSYDNDDEHADCDLYEEHEGMASAVRGAAAAIRAASPAVPAASGWQPIETAPKDGTVIGVSGGIAYWRAEKDGWYTLTAMTWPGARIQWPVTHWKDLNPSTLPAPPEVTP